MTKILNFLSGPCSGKSTAAAGLFYQMKLRHIKCELVTEYAKDLVYSDRLNMLTCHQEKIFVEQEYRQRRLVGKVDWVITDTSLLFSLIYCAESTSDAFKQLVVEKFRSYNNVCVFLKRPPTFQQYGRVHDLEQSIQIDQKILDTLHQHNIQYFTVNVDENVVNTILNNLDRLPANEAM